MKAKTLARTLTVLLAIPTLFACQSGLGQGPLDGRVYQVTLSGPKEATPDQLVFDGGRFESTACRSFGFRGVPYAAHDEGDASKFEAAATGGKSAKTAWNGAIHGDAIAGQMVMTDAEGKASNFTFTGKRSSGPLDGRVFEGMVCPGDSKTGDKDRLVFSSGAFDSNACRAYGFTMAPYTTTREGDTTHFSAEAINCSGDKNQWDGVISGDEISGTMKHANASGKVTDSYKFVAKRVN